MDRHTLLRQDVPCAAGLDHSRIWWLAYLGLCAWQVWLTLSLFAPPEGTSDGAADFVARKLARSQAAWERLTNEEPIVSGRHPLHLYFGHLGAQSFRERGSLCCYDPSFQAGYPKTPVFDAGSRPAELFLFLAGTGYRPAAYKLGLCVGCLLVPGFLAIGAKGFGLARGSTCLATALGLMEAGSKASRAMLESEDLDLLVAGSASLSFVGLLLAYHRCPHVGNWLGLVLLGCLGWFAHPLLWLLLVPIVLVYYLSIGANHSLGWHVALAAVLAVPLASNSFWLLDWLRYWWIRLPLQLGTASLKHRTFHTMWSCPLWGDNSDRILGIALLLLALAGIVVLNQTRERVAARLVGLGAGGFFTLTVVGLAWEPLGQLGAVQLLTPSLGLAILPVVYLLRCLLRQAAFWIGSCWRVALYGSLIAAVSAACLQREIRAWADGIVQVKPLALGLTSNRKTLVHLLRTGTTQESRILLEDLPNHVANPRWTVLLPLLTGRAYVGGLAPDGCIEHAYCGFVDQALLGRHISLWTDAELDDYCRRYNIGWIVGWSASVVQRLKAWRGEDAGIAVHDEVPGCLFPVGIRSFVLKGQAREVCVERGRMVLADVVPGETASCCSFHFRRRLRSPPQFMEQETDVRQIQGLRSGVPRPAPLIILT